MDRAPAQPGALVVVVVVVFSGTTDTFLKNGTIMQTKELERGMGDEAKKVWNVHSE